MLNVYIIQTDSVNYDISDRYDIKEIGTDNTLQFNIKREELCSIINKNRYYVVDGNQYLPQESNTRQTNNSRTMNAKNNTGIKIVTAIMLIYIWMYGIGFITAGFTNTLATIFIYVILSGITCLLIFVYWLDYKQKKSLHKTNKQ